MTLREALDALHRAGRIQSIGVIGMVWSDPTTVGDGWVDIDVLGDPPQAYQPALSVAATVGCLAALAREASGRRLAAAPYDDGWFVADPYDHDYESGRLGPTEGAAWEAAIIAMAEALP